jgi:hypothetical protein
LEFDLTYYNTNTFWLDLQNLLAVFGLPVSEPRAPASGLLEYAPADISAAIRQMANRMPTYVTLKDVKKRWGHGQEDIYPVTQFEKLWGDMTALPEMTARYFAVPRPRGQQLKDVAQLDPWLRDGSAAHVASLCDWS